MKLNPKSFLVVLLGSFGVFGFKGLEILIDGCPSLFNRVLPTRSSFILESVEENTPGIITFTTGTTGTPKGVVRNQGYLVHQHRILSKVLEIEKHKGLTSAFLPILFFKLRLRKTFLDYTFEVDPSKLSKNR